MQDGIIVGEEVWEGDKTLGTKMLSVIDELLVQKGMVLKDVQRIAVHGGPGHYSALRSGIVAATFLSTDKELVQLSGETQEELKRQALENKPVSAIVPLY
jgi:tRNA A37 threonylcarbamoyladenosine modification protein TsaB